MECPWIGKDDGIGSYVCYLFDRLFKDLDIDIPRKDVHREQRFASIFVEIIDRLFEIIKIIDLILPHPERGKRYADIDFFGSVKTGDDGFVMRSSGSYDYWFVHM